MPAEIATVAWPHGPAVALPRTVVPFHRETVASYIDRLAHANYLDPTRLRRYLTDTGTGCHPQADWLAIISAHPVHLLRARLIGLTERDHDLGRQRHHARPACRFCMARRGVTEPVYCWFPDHLTVCHHHSRWIGPGNRSVDDQRDLRGAPAVLTAARGHARLHRSHGDAAEVTLTEASRILRWWTATPSHTLSTATTCADTYIRAYPDLIDLASILAEGSRKILNTPAATLARHRAIDWVYTRVATRFPDYRTRRQPLEQWIGDRRIVAASMCQSDGRPRPAFQTRLARQRIPSCYRK